MRAGSVRPDTFTIPLEAGAGQRGAVTVRESRVENSREGRRAVRIPRECFGRSDRSTLRQSEGECVSSAACLSVSILRTPSATTVLRKAAGQPWTKDTINWAFIRLRAPDEVRTARVPHDHHREAGLSPVAADVNPWSGRGRDEGPPTSGVSPIRTPAGRMDVRAWRFPVHTTPHERGHQGVIADESPDGPVFSRTRVAAPV